MGGGTPRLPLVSQWSVGRKNHLELHWTLFKLLRFAYVEFSSLVYFALYFGCWMLLRAFCFFFFNTFLVWSPSLGFLWLGWASVGNWIKHNIRWRFRYPFTQGRGQGSVESWEQRAGNTEKRTANSEQRAQPYKRAKEKLNVIEFIYGFVWLLFFFRLFTYARKNAKNVGWLLINISFICRLMPKRDFLSVVALTAFCFCGLLCFN